MKPILFSTPMVQAIYEGHKSMTRRVIRPEIVDRFVLDSKGNVTGSYREGMAEAYPTIDDAPYQEGDILWVRETFCLGNIVCGENPDGSDAWYIELNKNGDVIPKQWAVSHNIGTEDVKWVPSIFMKREYSRIFLRVDEVYIERLQHIHERAVDLEGIDCRTGLVDLSENEWILAVKDRFRNLWDKLNASRGYGWDSNPWVWVISFERITREKALEATK